MGNIPARMYIGTRTDADGEKCGRERKFLYSSDVHPAIANRIPHAAAAPPELAVLSSAPSALLSTVYIYVEYI